MKSSHSHQKNLEPLHIYVRMKDKSSFSLSIKEPVILLSEIVHIVCEKVKLQAHDLIIFYQSELIYPDKNLAHH
jgi:hypothetical protein